VYEGELHYDVDTPEDLVHLKKELAANSEAALHTAEFLRSL
jgi:choline kinase